MTIPGRNLLKLNFNALDKKELKGSLGDVYGGTNGAIWTVFFHKDNSGIVLDHVKFDSGFDESVQAADQLVRRHYTDLSERKYERAYDDMSDGWRRKEPLDKFTRGNGAVHYSPEARKAPPEAIKIVEQSPDMVKLVTDLKWFTGKSDEYLRFVVRKMYGKWKIDQVDRMEKDEWDAI